MNAVRAIMTRGRPKCISTGAVRNSMLVVYVTSMLPLTELGERWM